MTTENARGNLDVIPRKAIRERYGGISETTLSRWIATGEFPKPFKIADKSYWYLSEIKEYEAARRQRG